MQSDQEVIRHLDLLKVTEFSSEGVSANIMTVNVGLTINFYNIEFYHVQLSFWLGSKDKGVLFSLRILCDFTSNFSPIKLWFYVFALLHYSRIHLKDWAEFSANC